MSSWLSFDFVKLVKWEVVTEKINLQAMFPLRKLFSAQRAQIIKSYLSLRWWAFLVFTVSNHFFPVQAHSYDPLFLFVFILFTTSDFPNNLPKNCNLFLFFSWRPKIKKIVPSDLNKILKYFLVLALVYFSAPKTRFYCANSLVTLCIAHFRENTVYSW